MWSAYLFTCKCIGRQGFSLPGSNLWDWSRPSFIVAFMGDIGCCRTRSLHCGFGRNTSGWSRKRGRSTTSTTSTWSARTGISWRQAGTRVATGLVTWQRNIWHRLKTFSPTDNGILTGDRLKSWRKKMSEKSGWAAENFDPSLKMCSPDIAGDNRQHGWKVVDTKKSRRNIWDKSVPYLYLPAISLGRRRAGRSQGPPTDDLRICARVQKEEPQGWFSHCFAHRISFKILLFCSQIGQICLGI